jgi:hypothetical protein
MKFRVFYIPILLIFLAFPVSLFDQDELKIWQEFVNLMKENKISSEHVRPTSPLTNESVLNLLDSFRTSAVWEEWDVVPEIVRYENLVTFIITLKQKWNSPWTYTFNFLVENDKWYFRHMEGIFIRLDKISTLPTSDFPDLEESLKDWARDEIRISEYVRIFNLISKEKGKDFAFEVFKNIIGNGIGYLLGAKTWVPFFPPHRAFILYLCWEQANLRGNKVTLVKLTDTEAVVRFDETNYFALYTRSGHLKKQISLEDYIKIYEDIWHTRAESADWKLKIEGKGKEITFYFTR